MHFIFSAAVRGGLFKKNKGLGAQFKTVFIIHNTSKGNTFHIFTSDSFCDLNLFLTFMPEVTSCLGTQDNSTQCKVRNSEPAVLKEDIIVISQFQLAYE